MYTILVKSDDTLVATQRQNIMHRSSLVRQLRFLVDPVYGDQKLNMADYVCVLEYRTPISNRYTMYATQASSTSLRLCVGMFVAIPTAIPDEPFTRRLGMRVGITVGSTNSSL